MIQSHEKFRSFANSDIDAVLTLAEEFASSVAAKSLAILFHDGKWIVSIGYCDDQTPYEISIDIVIVRPTDKLDERTSSAASDIEDEILCHSIYVDVTGSMWIAFMTK